MKNRFQSLFEAYCVQLLRNSTETYVRRIVFPPDTGRCTAKSMSVFS
ncbi:hypothetical protein J2S28_004957 [Rhizobium sp. SLBN-94]|jgi:hypothetical protein|nr:hypothetical protein [Rhizobium sp. SLBN-94]